MQKHELNESEIIEYLLGDKVIFEKGKWVRTNPDSYFLRAYSIIIAQAPTLQQKKAVLESVQNIESLVQSGLNQNDQNVPNHEARIVLGAIYPLLHLIGNIKSAKNLTRSYMRLITGHAIIPSKQDLDCLSEDLCLP